MTLPIPELKVLLYGPDISPNGVKARAHFVDSMLVVHGKEHHFTIQCDRLKLETGGFDGKQWMLTWMTSSGLVTAMLQGEQAVKALIKLAPPAFSRDISRSLQARGGAGRKLIGVLIAFAVVVVFLLLFWWFS
jgi:hypothetical protein